MHSPNVVYADRDDMLFANREKDYGAYDLRKKHVRHVFIGTIIVAMSFISISILPMLMAFTSVDEKIEEKRVVKVSMYELPPPPALEKDVLPPPPPPKLPPPKVRTVAFKIPEPTPEDELEPEEAEQTIAEVEELIDAPNIGLEDQEGAEEGFFDGEIEGEGTAPTVIIEEKIVEDVPDINDFIFVEEEPEPVNLEEVKQLIGYPRVAQDAGIEGRVILRVLVDEFGRYKNHKVINSVHPILASACEKHIGQLMFTPAIQGNTPVKFWINIPFAFKLLEDAR